MGVFTGCRWWSAPVANTNGCARCAGRTAGLALAGCVNLCRPCRMKRAGALLGADIKGRLVRLSGGSVPGQAVWYQAVW